MVWGMILVIICLISFSLLFLYENEESIRVGHIVDYLDIVGDKRYTVYTSFYKKTDENIMISGKTYKMKDIMLIGRLFENDKMEVVFYPDKNKNYKTIVTTDFEIYGN